MRITPRVVGLLLVLPIVAQSQSRLLRGVVRDSATSAVVPGVVLSLLDSAGIVIGRRLSDGQGTFVLEFPATATQVRLSRIGFRQRTLGVPRDSTAWSDLELSIVRVPTLLDPVDVFAAPKCQRGRSDADGLALLQQARAGLLTMIVARESSPATFVRLAYERTLGGRPDTISPNVRIDSGRAAGISFRAVRSGADLVRRGFTTDSMGKGIYFGPDAEVLLDENFEAGYCFRVVRSLGRRNQLGLSFGPAAPRRIGRIDVEGVLWLDGKERVLRDLEYRYVGLGGLAEDLDIGGSMSYAEMPNGSVIVSRWTLRLLKDRVDTLRGQYRMMPVTRQVVSDGGAIVARASWPDGTVWEAPLATLRVAAVDGEKSTPIAGADVRLRNTNYRATTDAYGIATFEHVMPGTYVPEVMNPELVSHGLQLVPDARNVGSADSTVTRASAVRPVESSDGLTRRIIVRRTDSRPYAVPMLTMTQLVGLRCGMDGRAIVGQVSNSGGDPAAGAYVQVRGSPTIVATNPHGGFLACLPSGDSRSFEVEAIRSGGRATAVVEPRGPATFVRLQLTAR